MSVNWAEVDELVKPTPSYEKLIEEIAEIWSYGFVQEIYGHDMGEAGEAEAKQPPGSQIRDAFTVDYMPERASEQMAARHL